MKKTDRAQSLALFFTVILVSVVLDLITKSLAVKYLTEDVAGMTVGKSVDIIKGVFSFTYHENPGAAWGMFADMPWLFMTVSSVAIIAIILYISLNKNLSALTAVSFACIAGGGIGNMIDRTLKGYVVDFLNFSLIDFPIFNVADIFVTVGAALVIIDLIFFEFAKEKQGTA